jgi:hypothetical protein
MIQSKILSRSLALILWIPILSFSLLLAHNAMLYFTHGGEYGILPEKLVARKDIVWNIAFYTHLPTGVICLLSPAFLFARKYFKQPLDLHRKIGKMYVWITVIIVCPTGMYLALYAKGGLITQIGFMIQGILLGVFTYQGYLAGLKGRKSDHVAFMIRSFSVAAVVLTFRILHIFFFILKVPYHDNYAISQWLGLSFNLLLAELIIVSHTLKNQKPSTLSIAHSAKSGT